MIAWAYSGRMPKFLGETYARTTRWTSPHRTPIPAGLVRVPIFTWRQG
jgi:hypothetical protein